MSPVSLMLYSCLNQIRFCPQCQYTILTILFLQQIWTLATPIANIQYWVQSLLMIQLQSYSQAMVWLSWLIFPPGSQIRSGGSQPPWLIWYFAKILIIFNPMALCHVLLITMVCLFHSIVKLKRSNNVQKESLIIRKWTKLLLLITSRLLILKQSWQNLLLNKQRQWQQCQQWHQWQ